MSLRNLGKSTLKVSSIGLGTWQFSGAKGFHKYFWHTLTQEIMDDIVKNSFSNGVNWFDTAELYGNGTSERSLSLALQHGQINENIVIATKWNPILHRSKTIAKTFPIRKDNLKPYPVDLLQIHNPYSISSLKSQLAEMHKLYDAQQIKAIGVSNFSTSKMAKSYEILENMGSSLSSNQVKYSIFDRTIEPNGLIEKAKELGITLIAYSPLEQGLATGRFHKDEQKINSLPFMRKRRIKRKLKKSQKAIVELEQIATNHNCSIAQIALNWIINAHGETVIAIPGASNVTQAISNAKALAISLSKEELDSIDVLTQDFL